MNIIEETELCKVSLRMQDNITLTAYLISSEHWQKLKEILMQNHKPSDNIR